MSEQQRWGEQRHDESKRAAWEHNKQPTNGHISHTYVTYRATQNKKPTSVHDFLIILNKSLGKLLGKNVEKPDLKKSYLKIIGVSQNP